MSFRVSVFMMSRVITIAWHFGFEVFRRTPGMLWRATADPGTILNHKNAAVRSYDKYAPGIPGICSESTAYL